MARSIRDPQSRERIITAAWRLVAEGGIGFTTMRAIAAEAGVTTGSVTHYFEDKAEVIDAVLEHNNRYALERINSAVRGLTGLNAARAYALALIPVEADVMAIWRVWLAFWTSNQVDELLEWVPEQGWGAWREGVMGHLRQAVADGELPPGLDLRYEADRLGTLVAGIGLVYGPAQHTGKGSFARTLRMLDDHLASLTQHSETTS